MQNEHAARLFHDSSITTLLFLEKKYFTKNKVRAVLVATASISSTGYRR